MGLCMAMGSAWVLMWIFMGLPIILARGAEEVLNLLRENVSSSQAFSLGTFTSMAGKGSSSARSGVSCHGLTSFLSSSSTPPHLAK